MSRINNFVSRDWASAGLGTLTRAVPLVLVLAVLIMAGPMSQAQDFTVIHNFSGPDGAYPWSTPTMDGHGNLYGTTNGGGAAGLGMVYQLAHVNRSWVMHPLYSFTGGSDGYDIFDGVTIGPDGTLFGVARGGGDAGGWGTLYNLKPPAHACAAAPCPWTETTLHAFAGGDNDGGFPSGIVFDSQGNLYGNTEVGGLYGQGTVYEATRSGGTWNFSVIYDFGASAADGGTPGAGPVLDSAGNLYGTTLLGGAYGYGTVFELSPSKGGWIETILHSFTGSDGDYPGPLGLVFDRAGTLYGATVGEYRRLPGTIFELSPKDGGWTFTTIYTFPISGAGSLATDATGNLYGANPDGGNGWGNVFEFSQGEYTDLYDFTPYGYDGSVSVGGVVVTGPGGYLYGTTLSGGAYYDGVIYQINLGAH